jgi:hypothetical protein
VLPISLIHRIPESRTKTPDFEWLGQRYGILLEAKAKVVPEAAEQSADAFVASWANLMEAIEQGSTFLRNRADASGRKWLLVVLVSDPITSERTSFRYAAARWGLLEQTEFVALAVLEAQDLEHLVQTLTADEVSEMLERLWQQSAEQHPMNQPPDVDPYREDACLPLVDATYRDLFGVSPRLRRS